MTLSDIEIARQANKKPIREIAKKINVDEESLHSFGHFVAKIPLNIKNKISEKKGPGLAMWGVDKHRENLFFLNISGLQKDFLLRFFVMDYKYIENLKHDILI